MESLRNHKNIVYWVKCVLDLQMFTYHFWTGISWTVYDDGFGRVLHSPPYQIVKTLLGIITLTGYWVIRIEGKNTLLRWEELLLCVLFCSFFLHNLSTVYLQLIELCAGRLCFDRESGNSNDPQSIIITKNMFWKDALRSTAWQRLTMRIFIRRLKLSGVLRKRKIK